MKTKGFVTANNYGALNVKNENGMLKLYLLPLQPLNEEIKIDDGDNIFYSKKADLKTLQLFTDSIKIERESLLLLHWR